MGVRDWLPSFGLGSDSDEMSFDSPDEEFEDVYDAYETLYMRLNAPKGRSRSIDSAFDNFIERVGDYYSLDSEELELGFRMGFVSNAELGGSHEILEEKKDEEELFEYLNEEF